MMTRWIIPIAIAAAGCGNEARKPPAPAPITPPLDAAPPTLTVDAVVELLDGVAACAITPTGLDPDCPGDLALSTAFYDARNELERPATFDRAARQQLGHASAAVRVAAFQAAAWRDDDPQLAQALATEPDAAALVAMIFRTSSNLETQPAVGAAVLALFEHPAAKVRRAAIASLGQSYNVEHPRLFDALAAHVERDPDPDVRADACISLGVLRDPRSVAVHDRMLVAATPPALFDACAVGLFASWLAAPDEHPVEAAYHRSLALLRHGPHRAGAPGAETIEAARGAVHDAHRTFDRLPSWVDPAEVIAALGGFVASPRADPAARTLAAEVIVEAGATIPALRALRRRVKDRGATGDELRDYLQTAESWVD